MHLIDTDTLRLEHVMNPEACQYAILSHTWEDGEVSFQDFSNLQTAELKSGFSKISMTCELAKKHGLKYAWVDTCCIDKSSSAELSEAINSMFRWYQDAAICFAYLTDLPPRTVSNPEEDVMSTSFPQCRWFTRGWTLQELIAPDDVHFYDQDWNYRGAKTDGNIKRALSEITRIGEPVLADRKKLWDVPVGVRMSWAASRRTTRVEARAYSLLGIFDVNMPMLYGEGGKAFRRLQEEILKESSDRSIFAWKQCSGESNAPQRFRGILARSLDEFVDCHQLRPSHDSICQPEAEFTMSNLGLTMQAMCCSHELETLLFLGYDYETGEGILSSLAVYVVKTRNGYVRSNPRELFGLPSKMLLGHVHTIRLRKDVPDNELTTLSHLRKNALDVTLHKPDLFELKTMSTRLRGFWDPFQGLFLTNADCVFTGSLHLTFKNKEKHVEWEVHILCGLVRRGRPDIHGTSRSWTLPWAAPISRHDRSSKILIEQMIMRWNYSDTLALGRLRHMIMADEYTTFSEPSEVDKYLEGRVIVLQRQGQDDLYVSVFPRCQDEDGDRRFSISIILDSGISPSEAADRFEDRRKKASFDELRDCVKWAAYS